jgi:hypothetical protein
MKLAMQRDGASAQCTMAGDESSPIAKCKLTFSNKSKKRSNFEDGSKQWIEEASG